MAHSNITVICQVVDEHDPINATAVRWIRVLSQKNQVGKVTVLALKVGEYNLPDNTRVFSFRGRNRISTLIKFYSLIIKGVMVNKTDYYFIYQGGPYPLLLLPFKLFGGKNVYHWKAHPHITFMMKLYARYCDTVVFTSTTNAFPMQLPNLRVIGQGVDTEKFRVLGKERNKDLVIVGRIAPVKRLESIIFILTHLNLKYGIAPKVDLYGPISGQDKKYKEHIDHLICEQKLNDQIIFHGPVRQDALPEIFNTHKLLVNFSDTALDRVVVEAMACGLPVFSTNNCVREIIPDAYHDILTCVDQHENHALLAELIYSLLLLPDAIRTHIGRDLREIILHHHSDITLFDRMLAEIGNYEK